MSMYSGTWYALMKFPNEEQQIFKLKSARIYAYYIVYAHMLIKKQKGPMPSKGTIICTRLEKNKVFGVIYSRMYVPLILVLDTYCTVH